MSINQKKKVMFISSTGGHFAELMRLAPMFERYDFMIVTEKTEAQYRSLKERYGTKAKFLIFGTREHPITYPFKLFANCWISLAYFIVFRPEIVVTTGTHTAAAMCCIGKFFRRKIVYIETFANVDTMTATGRRIYKFADLFIVQHEEMLALYPKAVCFGGIF
jgi:UDP-N-acetylglucosamine:LPS N-acetylglucosamine transferase